MIRAAKPFLKWAGGKGQLIEEYRKLYPNELKNGKIKKYFEPLLGGGAVFFDVIKNYEVEEVYINDANHDLMLSYKVIKNDVEDLITNLKNLEDRFHVVEDSKKSNVFYEIRDLYNSEGKEIDYKEYSKGWIKRAAKLIFLNRTCFNGLFRVNSRGEYNVPFGKYKNPKICDQENLIAVSKVLESVNILCVDYKDIESLVDEYSLVYFDPPYRPLTKTASFTSYSKDNFNDEDQKRLGEFYRKLDSNHAKLMLSNSDPKNIDENDNFFDELYEGFNIYRIKANRMINSKASGRKAINELLITNYNN